MSSEAGRYDAKAAEYRQEAAAHRKMVEEVRERTVQMKDRENPAVAKMRDCKVYLDQAGRLAAAADRLADYYRLRAAELKSK